MPPRVLLAGFRGGLDGRVCRPGSSCDPSRPLVRRSPRQRPLGVVTLHVDPLDARQGHKETFPFFVTANSNSQAFLALRLLQRPLPRKPAQPGAAAVASALGVGSMGVNGGASLFPSVARPGDVVLGEGLIDLSALFPIHQAMYPLRGRKGNTKRVAVPLRDPVTKR